MPVHPTKSNGVSIRKYMEVAMDKY
jgi:hypothetical protein